MHVGDQSKACRALRSAKLEDWGTKEIRNERMIGLEIPSVVYKLRGKPNEMDRLNLRLAPGMVGKAIAHHSRHGYRVGVTVIHLSRLSYYLLTLFILSYATYNT